MGIFLSSDYHLIAVDFRAPLYACLTRNRKKNQVARVC